MGKELRFATFWVLIATANAFCGEADSLPVRSNWVDFEIVLGQITAWNFRGPAKACTSYSNPERNLQESFSVAREASSPVHYERVEGTRRLLVAFTAINRVVIQQEVDGETELTFRQKENSVELALPENRRYTAPTLWHLALQEETICREHLWPLFAHLSPQLDLSHRRDEICGELVKTSPTDCRLCQEKWMNLVNQLGAENFQQRQAADRALREAGRASLFFLAQLDRQALDAEQRKRLVEIRQWLTSGGADSPAMVAQWLAADAEVWRQLLIHDQPHFRQAAAMRLAELQQTGKVCPLPARTSSSELLPPFDPLLAP